MFKLILSLSIVIVSCTAHAGLCERRRVPLSEQQKRSLCHHKFNQYRLNINKEILNLGTAKSQYSRTTDYLCLVYENRVFENGKCFIELRYLDDYLEVPHDICFEEKMPQLKNIVLSDVSPVCQ